MLGPSVVASSSAEAEVANAVSDEDRVPSAAFDSEHVNEVMVWTFSLRLAFDLQ